VLQVLNEPLCIFNLIEVFKDRFFPFSIIESAKWESESESESGSESERVRSVMIGVELMVND
jgi:hypothetical protein